MAQYIRSKAPGASYFFTARLANRNAQTLVHEIATLRRAMRATKLRYPFQIDEIVVLPAAIHTIWTLPSGDADFSTRWRMLKSLFSRALPAPEVVSDIARKRGEKGIWQRRFWEHHLRDAEDFEAHRHMILKAPVQAGLVRRAQDWQYSSIHRAMREGTFDPNAPVGYGYTPTTLKKRQAGLM